MKATVLQLSLPHSAIGFSASCDRCVGGRARWSTPAGLLCGSCRSVVSRQGEELRAKLAEAYGVSVLYVEECLIDEQGQCSVSARPSIAPALHYRPCWQVAARDAAERSAVYLGLQCRTVGRLLWGAGLHLGLDMPQHPRKVAYHPSEIDRDVVRWAVEDEKHLLWLRCYGRALLQLRADHASLTASLDWMRGELALLRQQAPSLLTSSGQERA